MSKKKKDKFKKQIKAQILEQMARVEATPASSSMSPATIVKSDVPSAKPAQAVTADLMIQNLPQIKYDLKKTAIVIAILALVIVALVLLDQKYNILLNFGQALFRVLHIQ